MNTSIRRDVSGEFHSTGRQRGRVPDRIQRDPVGEAAEDLCEAVLSPLRRRDQREKGRQYVRGLLVTEGRKSVRNMAQQFGGPAAEQSLHHFVSDSTWDWQPLRTALSHYLERSTPLTAWVVQPLAIPKSGDHSVGAGHRFDPHQGQMFRGQQAFGTWFTSPDVVSPVGWRLFLPQEERGPLDAVGVRAEGAGEEPGLQRETYGECAATGALDIVCRCQTPARPVVLDVRDIATRATMRRFHVARVPVLARISPTARLLVTDPSLPGYGGGTLTARDILQNVKALRVPVEWPDPADPGVRRSSLVAAVRVVLPDPAPARRREVLLFGEWADPRRLPSHLWVTDMTRLGPAALLRMTKQARRVSAAAQSVQEVGLRDFAGRSLSGWHRHVTMASVAHAARCLAAASAAAAAHPPLPRPAPAPQPAVRLHRPAAPARAYAALAGR